MIKEKRRIFPDIDSSSEKEKIAENDKGNNEDEEIIK